MKYIYILLVISITISLFFVKITIKEITKRVIKSFYDYEGPYSKTLILLEMLGNGNIENIIILILFIFYFIISLIFLFFISIIIN